MSVTTLTRSVPPTQDFARLLRELHALIQEGKGDGSEADALRDAMDGLWYAMTEPERERMGGLSEDLYALAEGGAKYQEMTPEEAAAWHARARAAFAGFQGGGIDAALTFLRQPAPSHLPRHVIPFLQARGWERLADPGTALLFMKEAEKYDPRSAIMVMVLLGDLNRTAEVDTYAWRILDDPGATPAEVYYAAAWVAAGGCGSRRPFDPPLRRLIPILETALRKAWSTPAEAQEVPNTDDYLTCLLGLCYEKAGRTRDALKLYDEAIRLHPNNTDLLAFRGLCRLQMKDQAAYDDLRRAVQLGTHAISPYLLLAVKAFEGTDYLRAVELAKPVTQLNGPPELIAEGYHLLALAYAMLGQPLDWVIYNFDQAEKLKPDDPSRDHNRKVAEARANHRDGSATWALPDRFNNDLARQTILERGQREWSEQHRNQPIDGSLAA